MSYSTEFPDFEFDPLESNTVVLFPAAVDWAIQVCQQERDENQQWQTFLRALALKGLQQWLEVGASNLTLDYDIHYPPRTGIHARVKDFRLCLVVQGSLSDEAVCIPQSTLDAPHHFAHLYVLVEVREEAKQVVILGGLRRDRLLAHQQQMELAINADDTYTIPIAYFDTTPDDLLLYLNCLNPEWLAAASQTVERSIATPVGAWIDVGRWLQDRLDTVAETLTWTLLPPLAPTHALMSAHTPVEVLEAILRELELTGVVIPASAKGAYTDLQPIGLPFRLYALVWTLFESSPPEWSLFLVLGPVPGEQLPPNTRLKVRDATTLLVDRTLTPELNATHLYAQVIGTWDEQFIVSVELPDGSTLNWPPFVFKPEREQM